MNKKLLVLSAISVAIGVFLVEYGISADIPAMRYIGALFSLAGIAGAQQSQG